MLPRPYYQDEWVTIYHGDCRGILSDLPKVDLVLTDPPYGLGLDMVYRHGTNTNLIHTEIDWNNQTPDPGIFDLIYQVSKHQVVWGCNYFGDNIKAVGRIVHDKMLDIKGTKLKWSEADIVSCSLQNRVTIFSYRWNGNVQGDTINWSNTGLDARYHPTQKPLALMRYCIDNYTSTDHTILDPFLGSGTTAVAAKHLNRHCIGIEIEEKYCEIAAKRCSQQVFDFGEANHAQTRMDNNQTEMPSLWGEPVSRAQVIQVPSV